jgi:hypothetical protein
MINNMKTNNMKTITKLKLKKIIPKTMSEALLLADKDKNLRESRSCYLDEWIPDNNHFSPRKLACAIGSIFLEVASKADIEMYINDPPDDGRESLIEIICKKIKGSCESIPEEILESHIGMSDTVVFNAPYRWIDLAEWLYQYKFHSLKETAEILKTYNK